MEHSNPFLNGRVTQIIYDIRKTLKKNIKTQKFEWCTSIFHVAIIHIDEENQKIYASWNNEQPKWFDKNSWRKWTTKPIVNNYDEIRLVIAP